MWASVKSFYNNLTGTAPQLFYDEECTALQAAEKHSNDQGEIARVMWEGKETVITSKPSLAEAIFKDPSFHARFGTQNGLERLGMHNKGVIWNNDNVTWKRARKHGFQPHLANEYLKEGAAVAAASMSRQVKSGLKAGGTFDMLKALRLATLEVPLRVFLGIRGELETEFLEEIVSAVVGYFGAWEYFLYRKRTDECEHDVSVRRLYEISKTLLEMAKDENGEDETNFVAEATRSPDAVQLVLELLLATTDTSSVSLFYLMVQLAGDKQLQDKLAATDCEGDLATNCLKEAMRFKPVGPVVLRQARTDTECDGEFFKAGSCVIINLMRIHKRSDIFPNPDCFDPDRFVAVPKFFFPFGNGDKGCIGQHLAMKEMMSVLAVTLSIATLSFPTDQKVQRLSDVETKWEVANQPKDPILFVLRER